MSNSLDPDHSRLLTLFGKELMACCLSAGIVWCMQHDSDLDNEMDTEDQLERNQPDGSVHAGNAEPAAPWSLSESTVLSEASKYFSQLDQR